MVGQSRSLTSKNTNLTTHNPLRLARHAKVLSADVRMFHKWSEETSEAPSEEEEEEKEGVQVASSQDGADLMAPTHENWPLQPTLTQALL